MGEPLFVLPCGHVSTRMMVGGVPLYIDPCIENTRYDCMGIVGGEAKELKPGVRILGSSPQPLKFPVAIADQGSMGTKANGQPTDYITFVAVESTAEAPPGDKWTGRITRVVDLAVPRKARVAFKRASGVYIMADGKTTATTFLYIDGKAFQVIGDFWDCVRKFWPDNA